MAKAAEWAERVRAWRRSGLSSSEFARGEEFTGRALLWWSSHFGRHGYPKAVRGGSRGVTLARVVRTPSAPTSSTSAVVIELRDARVLVSAGAEPATVSMVLHALRASAVQEPAR
jgi:hypothetical protein